jgi:hypothetical protein
MELPGGDDELVGTFTVTTGARSSWSTRRTRGGDFYLATSGDFHLAIDSPQRERRTDRHCEGRRLDPARSGVDPHGHQQANVNRLTNTDDIDVVTAWCAIPAYPSPCTRGEPVRMTRAALGLIGDSLSEPAVGGPLLPV